MMLGLLGLGGCDLDARRCKEERGDVLSNYAACNRSCERKQNAASCKSATRMAPDVCREHPDDEKACKVACENGHTDSCAHAGIATVETKKPEEKLVDSPFTAPPVSLIADWPTVTFEGVTLKIPKRPTPKTTTLPGGHTMHVFGEESADGHHVSLSIIQLNGDVGRKMLEQEKKAAFPNVPGKTLSTKMLVTEGTVWVEVRFTAKKPVAGVEWLFDGREKKRMVKVTVIGKDRLDEDIVRAVRASLEIERN